MIGNLEPEEHVMSDRCFTQEDLWELMQTLGWDVRNDNIALEVGGTSVYMIDGAGTRWAPVKGTRKYNKDAFIVIKNRSRDPVVPSMPIPIQQDEQTEQKGDDRTTDSNATDVKA